MEIWKRNKRPIGLIVPAIIYLCLGLIFILTSGTSGESSGLSTFRWNLLLMSFFIAIPHALAAFCLVLFDKTNKRRQLKIVGIRLRLSPVWFLLAISFGLLLDHHWEQITRQRGDRLMFKIAEYSAEAKRCPTSFEELQLVGIAKPKTAMWGSEFELGSITGDRYPACYIRFHSYGWFVCEESTGEPSSDTDPDGWWCRD